MLIYLAILMFITGLIIGLGAVTVIDLHGFMGRKSSYWTEATTRSHKITKPLIWLGTFLMSVGSLYFYFTTSSRFILVQAIIIVILILNGMFLSFSVSPYLLKKEKVGKATELLSNSWQKKITISFIISFIGWWTIVSLFAFTIYKLL